MNLSVLRKETEQQHHSLEALLPLSSLDLDLPRYGQILQYFYLVVEQWEDWAIAKAPSHLTGLVEERRRLPLLRRDLELFGLFPLPVSVTDLSPGHPVEALLPGTGVDSPGYEAAFLGAMYVMEGSTLGGQYIARHVEDLLGLAAGKGDAYFRGYGEHTGSMWNAFREVLSALPEEQTALVIAAAQVTFTHLEDVFRICPAALQLSPSAAP